MPFALLHSYLPDLARNETRTITVPENSNLSLPPGEYGFCEMFCDEPGCDCRRVFFLVFAGAPPELHAVIAFGWESTEFYAEWAGEDDLEYAATLKGPELNLASPQGHLAPALLDVAKNVLLRDELYVARVKRHYELFRQAIEEPREPHSSDSRPTRPRSKPLEVASESPPGPTGTASASSTLAHTNRFGRTYYLHEGRTKTGKPRYCVRKTIGDGALANMPSGFEFVESLNGVVSVRRVDTSEKAIPAVDVGLVTAELSKHEHLSDHVVDVRKDAILICEPIGRMSPRELETTAQQLRLDPALLQRITLEKPSRFEPVMKFERTHSSVAPYVVFRMTYRGDGGWHLLSTGELSELVRGYVRHIETDEFYELL